MLAPVVVLLVVVVLGGLVVFWMLKWGKARAATAEELEKPDTETLEYLVPGGQDPVVVMSALEAEGFTTRMDTSGEVLHIHCPNGRSSRGPTRRPSSTAGPSTTDA